MYLRTKKKHIALMAKNKKSSERKERILRGGGHVTFLPLQWSDGVPSLEEVGFVLGLHLAEYRLVQASIFCNRSG